MVSVGHTECIIAHIRAGIEKKNESSQLAGSDNDRTTRHKVRACQSSALLAEKILAPAK